MIRIKYAKTPGIVLLLMMLLTGTYLRAQQETDYTVYVNPFTGTGGHGHTFPGATLPFGMVQLSPDTRLEGWDGCSGYHYSDTVVYGFSHTHLSGTGCADYGDILLMPLTDQAPDDTTGVASPFDHRSESASPGYYSVYLKKWNTLAELTATTRTGMHRYSFPAGSKPFVSVDLCHRDEVTDAWLEQTSAYELRGMRRSAAWADDQRVFFIIRFSRPIVRCTFDENDQVQVLPGGKRAGKKIRTRLEFAPGTEPLTVKVALSATGTEGALKNMDFENPGWNFDSVRNAARLKWNSELSKIEISSDYSVQKKIFYTALYHSLICPNIYSDADGSYLGRDLKVHKTEGFDYYTVFSLWDTYRAEHPLLCITDRKRTLDFIQTFLKQYEQGGRLPVWELSSCETFCMIGYHSIPVIADAYLNGIRNFNTSLAIEAMKHSATEDRAGIREYINYGYVPSDKEHESVSKTLEYAYDDWCIARMAEVAGDSATANEFYLRSQYWKNLLDPATGFFRARENGGWIRAFDPAEVSFNYTEANAWQYAFYVPHDISGLAELLGGNKAAEKKLDKLFNTSSKLKGREQADISGLIGQYAHGNEPSHHIAYLYNYLGRSAKSQKMVRQIVTGLYQDGPEGLCGNEDCGQMSAWYVFSAMGFYPVCPGASQYVFGTPAFPEASIHLENGNTFKIIAENLSNKNFYIQSASLNGKILEQPGISYQDIMTGGELRFTMGHKPRKIFKNGISTHPAPFRGSHILTTPVIAAPSQTFENSLRISISTNQPGTRIYYTTDGSQPGPESLLYTGSFGISESCVVKAVSVDAGSGRSLVSEATYLKSPSGKKIRLTYPPNSQYAAGGNNALIDGKRGGENFRLGAWQGFTSDLEAVIDLGKMKPVSHFSVGFLQDQGSWIWMPLFVEFSTSVDGKNFVPVGRVDNTIAENDPASVTKDFILMHQTNARYVKIFAKNYGVCPPWHAGAGGKAWLFADEIIIE